jgi:glycerophosphoryl diester phosphodiesterase
MDYKYKLIGSSMIIDGETVLVFSLDDPIVDVPIKMEMEKQVEYTTFSETVCRMIHEINPDAKVLWIATGVHVKDAAYAKSKGYNGISYDLNAWLNRPEVAAQAAELGVETTLWMANDYEVIDWAIRHKIDYISTDYPAKAVEYLKAVKNYN